METWLAWSMLMKKERAKPKGPTPNQVVRQEDLLRQGVQQTGALVEEHSIVLLIDYINLLLQQNHTINLTAITDPL